MADNKPNGFQLLGGLGLDLDTEVEGFIVTEAKKTSRPNLFQLKATNGTKEKTFFVGKKSIDEGMLTQNEKGETVIAKGYDLFDQNGQIFARNKNNVSGEIRVL